MVTWSVTKNTRNIQANSEGIVIVCCFRSSWTWNMELVDVLVYVYNHLKNIVTWYQYDLPGMIIWLDDVEMGNPGCLSGMIWRAPHDRYVKRHGRVLSTSIMDAPAFLASLSSFRLVNYPVRFGVGCFSLECGFGVGYSRPVLLLLMISRSSGASSYYIFQDVFLYRHALARRPRWQCYCVPVCPESLSLVHTAY